MTGASGGIGSAVARAFAAEGARVACHFHRGRDRAEAVPAELGRAPAFHADLTDETQVDALFAESRAALGGVDVCAAVAGVWPSADEPVWELRSSAGGRRSTRTSPRRSSRRGFLREVERPATGISS